MPEPLFNKVAGLRPPTLFKKRLWHMCFPVDFAKFLRAPFLQDISGKLLLEVRFELVSFIVIQTLFFRPDAFFESNDLQILFRKIRDLLL